MQVFSESINLKKIKTGFSVDRSTRGFGDADISAFSSWEAVLDYLKNNPPRMYKSEYKDGDYTAEFID